MHSMIQQHRNTINSPTTGENMPDIQALNLRVQGLGQSVDWWNSAMIWALVFAAIAAVAVVITTRKSITQTGKLSEVQAELARAKEAQLALDLKSTDEAIAATKERTA